MKNITLALAIALGFCATESGAQARGFGSLRERRALREQQRKMNFEQKLPDDLRTKMTPEEIQEYDLWTTWPKEAHWGDTNIFQMCEKELNVIFRRNSCGGWTKGCGKAYIDDDRYLGSRGGWNWKKYDSDGILIRAGHHTCFTEYAWLTNCAAHVTIENRKKWASEHGMSYEDAVRKRKSYFDALSVRHELEEAKKKRLSEVECAAEAEKERAQREAEKEAERAEAEKEREETQKKLAEMAAELQKQREAATKKGE